MKVTLIGVDPGVVDTALAVLRLDTESKTYNVHSRVWTGVSRMEKQKFIIQQAFLQRLGEETRRWGTGDVVVRAVEGYRNRGNNMRQDQQMSAMVEACSKAIKGSTIVDNTGVKNVVKPGLMKLFNFGFQRTNHRDLESAVRIAIKLGLADDDANKALSDFVLDHLLGTPWTKA